MDVGCTRAVRERAGDGNRTRVLSLGSDRCRTSVDPFGLKWLLTDLRRSGADRCECVWTASHVGWMLDGRGASDPEVDDWRRQLLVLGGTGRSRVPVRSANATMVGVVAKLRFYWRRRVALRALRRAGSRGAHRWRRDELYR